MDLIGLVDSVYEATLAIEFGRRFANLFTVQNGYVEKQKKVLGNKN